MSRVNLFLSSLVVLTLAVTFAGCSGAGNATSPAAPGQSEAADHDHAGHDDADHAEDDHDHGAIEAAMAKLSDEDRAAAEAQETCPVSGELLGSMGAPYKVTVTTGAGEPRTVFLCCQGCESSITENPDEYLAKLDK